MNPMQRAKYGEVTASLIAIKHAAKRLSDATASSDPKVNDVYDNAKEIALEALKIVEWAKVK